MKKLLEVFLAVIALELAIIVSDVFFEGSFWALFISYIIFTLMSIPIEFWIKKQKKIALLLISLSTLVIVCLAFFWKVFWGTNVEIKNGRDEYGDFSGFLGYSNLLIFPEMISGNVEEVEYYYYNRNSFMDPVCQVYLKCKYDKNDFASEMNRLAEIECEHNGKKNTIKYDKDGFSYPAFVTINNWSSCDEYAVVDEEQNAIIYVYTQGIPAYRIKVPQKYRYNYKKTNSDSFSMYSFDGYFEMKYR